MVFRKKRHGTILAIDQTNSYLHFWREKYYLAKLRLQTYLIYIIMYKIVGLHKGD